MQATTLQLPKVNFLTIKDLIETLRRIINSTTALEKVTADEATRILSALESYAPLDSTSDASTFFGFAEPKVKNTLKEVLLPTAMSFMHGLMGMLFKSPEENRYIMHAGQLKDYYRQIIKTFLLFVYMYSGVNTSLCHARLQLEQSLHMYDHMLEPISKKALCFIELGLDVNFSNSSTGPMNRRNFKELEKLYKTVFEYITKQFKNSQFSAAVEQSNALLSMLDKQMRTSAHVPVTKEVPPMGENASPLANQTRTLFPDVGTTNEFTKWLAQEERCTTRSANAGRTTSFGGGPAGGMDFVFDDMDYMDLLGGGDEDCCMAVDDLMGGSELIRFQEQGQMLAPLTQQLEVSAQEQVTFNKSLEELDKRVREYLGSLAPNLTDELSRNESQRKVSEIYEMYNKMFQAWSEIAHTQLHGITNFTDPTDYSALISEVDREAAHQIVDYNQGLEKFTEFVFKWIRLLQALLTKCQNIASNIGHSVEECHILQNRINVSRILLLSTTQHHMRSLRPFDFVVHNFIPYDLLPVFNVLCTYSSSSPYEKYQTVKAYLSGKSTYLQINGFVLTSLEEYMLTCGSGDSFFDNTSVRDRYVDLYNRSVETMFEFCRSFLYGVAPATASDPLHQFPVLKTPDARTEWRAATLVESATKSTKIVHSTSAAADFTATRNKYVKCLSTLPMLSSPSKDNASGLFHMQNFLNNFELVYMLELASAVLSPALARLQPLYDMFMFYLNTVEPSKTEEVPVLLQFDFTKLFFALVALHPQMTVQSQTADATVCQIKDAVLLGLYSNLLASRPKFLDTLRPHGVSVTTAGGVLTVECDLRGTTVDASRADFSIKPSFYKDLAESADGSVPNILDYIVTPDAEDRSAQTDMRIRFDSSLQARLAFLSQNKHLRGLATAFSFACSTGFVTLKPLSLTDKTVRFELTS